MAKRDRDGGFDHGAGKRDGVDADIPRARARAQSRSRRGNPSSTSPRATRLRGVTKPGVTKPQTQHTAGKRDHGGFDHGAEPEKKCGRKKAQVAPLRCHVARRPFATLFECNNVL